MKKNSILVISLILILWFALVGTLRYASASVRDFGSEAWILPNSSVNFNLTNVDLAAQSAPGWLQQLF